MEMPLDIFYLRTYQDNLMSEKFFEISEKENTNSKTVTAILKQPVRRPGRPRTHATHEQVLSLRAEGLSFKEVGQKLGIGKSTAYLLSKGTIRDSRDLRTGGIVDNGI